MKKIVEFLKKVVFSGFLLYGYNLIAVNFGLIIPINIFNILFLSFLGAPALLALALFKIIIL